MLAPDGVLWLVANRHLPYDAALSEAFLEVETIGGDAPSA
jgi:16S rRNA (guanine1207-N2)-methyltransferase